jgi:hypothetical protein
VVVELLVVIVVVVVVVVVVKVLVVIVVVVVVVIVVGSVALTFSVRHLILSSVTVVRMGERRGVYRVLVGKPEGKRQLARPRRRWEDNIKLDLQEVGCRGYGQDRAGSR